MKLWNFAAFPWTDFSSRIKSQLTVRSSSESATLAFDEISLLVIVLYRLVMTWVEGVKDMAQWSLVEIGSNCSQPPLYSQISVNTRSSVLSSRVGKSTICLKGNSRRIIEVSRSLKSPQMRNLAVLWVLTNVEVCDIIWSTVCSFEHFFRLGLRRMVNYTHYHRVTHTRLIENPASWNMLIRIVSQDSTVGTIFHIYSHASTYPIDTMRREYFKSWDGIELFYKLVESGFS